MSKIVSKPANQAFLDNYSLAFSNRQKPETEREDFDKGCTREYLKAKPNERGNHED